MIQKEQLQDLYKQGLSMTKIANQLNVSYITVSRYTKRYNLEPNYLRGNKPNKKNTIRICSKCGETDITKFYKSSYYLCKSCNKVLTKDNNKKRKEKYMALLGGKCQVCGYDKYYGVLEFHHKDPSTKSELLNKQTLIQYNDTFIKEELKKCILVCSNCHREIHAGLINVN